MEPVRLTDRASFRPERFLPWLIYGSGRARAFLVCLEPGQGLAPRADPEEMLCYVLAGQGRLTLGEAAHEVSAGHFAAAGPGERRGLEATERLIALWVHIGRGGEAGDAG